MLKIVPARLVIVVGRHLDRRLPYLRPPRWEARSTAAVTIEVEPEAPSSLLAAFDAYSWSQLRSCQSSSGCYFGTGRYRRRHHQVNLIPYLPSEVHRFHHRH